MRKLLAVATLALSLPTGVTAASAASRSADTQTPSDIQNFNAQVWCIGTQNHQDDTQAILQYCDTGPGDTLWHVGSENPAHRGYYQIINANNQCLGVTGGSTAQGAEHRLVDLPRPGASRPVLGSQARQALRHRPG